MSDLQRSNSDLAEQLQIANQRASKYEQALEEANSKIKEQESIIGEAQITRDLHQHQIQQLIATLESFQLRCLHGSEVLLQAVGILHGTNLDDQVGVE